MEVKFKKVKGLLATAPTPAAGQTLSKEVSLPDPKPQLLAPPHIDSYAETENFFHF